MNTIKQTTQLRKFNFNTSDWISGISALIALVALFISIFTSIRTNDITNKDYFLTHRPYVWVENFGYLDNQNKIINPINEVMIRVLNSPATFIGEYYEYYLVDKQGIKTTVEKQEYKNQIRYPDDKSQYTNTSSKVTEQLVNFLPPDQILERIAKINYSWLSSEKTYFFEAKWRFDTRDKSWIIIAQKAN